MPSQIKKTTPGLKLSYVLLVIGLCVIVVCGVLLGLTQSTVMSSVAAQDDAAQLQQEKTVKKKVNTATTKVVNLVSLMGSTKAAAVSLIGHGAKIESETNQTATIVLTDEAGDNYVGTPTVVLTLNNSGIVVGATYSAGTTALGYGDFSFDEAVSEVYLIENTLRAAGLTSMELGSVQLPSKSAYSLYNTDGKTLSAETYTFTGVCSEANTAYEWSATLTYDYTEANSTGNLANTIKTIRISIE